MIHEHRLIEGHTPALWLDALSLTAFSSCSVLLLSAACILLVSAVAPISDPGRFILWTTVVERWRVLQSLACRLSEVQEAPEAALCCRQVWYHDKLKKSHFGNGGRGDRGKEAENIVSLPCGLCASDYRTPSVPALRSTVSLTLETHCGSRQLLISPNFVSSPVCPSSSGKRRAREGSTGPRKVGRPSFCCAMDGAEVPEVGPSVDGDARRRGIAAGAQEGQGRRLLRARA